MKISDLNPAPYNPRSIQDKALEGLDKSLQKFGDISGIVFNIRTKHVVGGHQRLKNIPQDSEITTKTVEDDPTGTVAIGHIVTSDGRKFSYREVDWDNLTEKAANIAANSETISGDWVLDELDPILKELDDELEDFQDLNLDELQKDITVSTAQDNEDEQHDTTPNSTKQYECPECGHRFED